MRLRGTRIQALIVTAISVLPVAALAQGSEPPRAELFNSAYMMQVIGALLLVFGCLFGLAFVMKKLNGVPTGDRKSLRITSSVKVGAREKILLLETGENVLLVGVAAGNVRTLYVYENNGELADEPKADFASLMSDAASSANATGASA